MAGPVFDLQPMSVGDILDRSVRLYKRAFLHTLGIVALPFLLAISMGAVSVPFVGIAVSRRGRPGPGLMAAGGLFILLFIWLSFVSMGAMARSVSERFLGGTPTIWSAYRAVLKRGLTLIWAYFLGALAFGGLVGLGGFLIGALGAIGGPIFAVPIGIAVAVAAVVVVLRLFLVTQVIVIEGSRGPAALQRSWSLMRGNFWRAVLVLIFGIAMNILVSVVLTVPGAVLAEALPEAVTVILKGVTSLLANVLFAPFMSIAFTLLYYDSRIRKEGFDLEMMARNLGAPQRPGAAASAASAAARPSQISMADIPTAEPAGPGTPDSRRAPAEPSASPPRPPASPAGAPKTAPVAPAHSQAPAARRGPGAFKVCPKCGAQVSLVRATCPSCGTPVPFRSAG